jgi:hypothetical protein
MNDAEKIALIITLKDFRKMINDPKLDKHENLPVIYSKDDEGNGYDRILFAPTVMAVEEISNDRRSGIKKGVCIN